jgi:hypothetical protein
LKTGSRQMNEEPGFTILLHCSCFPISDPKPRFSITKHRNENWHMVMKPGNVAYFMILFFTLKYNRKQY